MKSITVTGNKTVSVNKTIRLKAIVKPDNATAKDIEWEVSNTGSAVIDTNTGILRAYKPGKVNVIAKACLLYTSITNVENITEVISFGARYGQKITIVVNGYNEDNASELVKEYIKNNL